SYLPHGAPWEQYARALLRLRVRQISNLYRWGEPGVSTLPPRGVPAPPAADRRQVLVTVTRQKVSSRLVMVLRARGRVRLPRCSSVCCPGERLRLRQVHRRPTRLLRRNRRSYTSRKRPNHTRLRQ